MALRLSSPSIRHSNPSEISVGGSVMNSLTVVRSAANTALVQSRVTISATTRRYIAELFIGARLDEEDSAASAEILPPASLQHATIHEYDLRTVDRRAFSGRAARRSRNSHS